MKCRLFLGCLAGIFLSAACERLDNDRDLHTGGNGYLFTLEDVAQLVAAVPVGEAQIGEVRDAVSASCGNGYDDEYMMKDLFLTPGTGIGAETATRVETYPEPLRDLLAEHVRRTLGGTRALDAEQFLDQLASSDVQIYWPYSELFDGSSETPVITFDPGDNSVRNIGYLRREDGSVEELIVDEDMARRRPVWVISRNADAEYRSLEMRRREDPDWGTGGGIIGAETRASSNKNYFQTLVLRSIQANRNSTPGSQAAAKSSSNAAPSRTLRPPPRRNSGSTPLPSRISSSSCGGTRSGNRWISTLSWYPSGPGCWTTVPS